MNRLYQWLSEGASFFRSDTFGRSTSRTVRTEATIERQGITLRLGDTTVDLDTCPLCGSKLDAEHMGQTGHRQGCDLAGTGSGRPASSANCG